MKRMNIYPINNSFFAKLAIFFLIIFFIVTIGNSWGQDAQWQRLDTRISRKRINYQPNIISQLFREPIVVDLIRIDPTLYNIKVLDSRQVLGKRNNPLDYSLNQLYEKKTPLAIINGGFTASFQYPQPVGLIISDNQTTNPLNQSNKYLQNGIFCIQNNQAIIMKKSSYQESSCSQALQNGPIIIYQEHNEIAGLSGEFFNFPSERSIVCIDNRKRVLLLRTGKASLHNLVGLIKEECTVALNLSGSSDSGMVYQRNSRKSEIGFTNSLVPSAIGVFP